MKPQNIKNIIFRQQIISLVRQFFVQKSFQEIDLPILKTSIPLEQNIYPFQIISSHTKTNLILSTSPESGLKKLIAQHPGNYFSISPSFRNLEAKGPTHQPEFLMLEWYQTDANYLRTLQTTQKLILFIAQGLVNIKYNRTNNILTFQKSKFDLTPPWPKISLKTLFKKYANINLDTLLSSTDFSEKDFNQKFLNHIEPHLSTSRPTFITDYPASISPLASKSGLYADRFELYFGPLEIANGNTENNSNKELTRAVKTEQNYRTRYKLPIPPIDYDFIKASSRLSQVSGCGLGIDRLTMLFADSYSIDRVRPFPL